MSDIREPVLTGGRRRESDPAIALAIAMIATLAVAVIGFAVLIIVL